MQLRGEAKFVGGAVDEAMRDRWEREQIGVEVSFRTALGRVADGRRADEVERAHEGWRVRRESAAHHKTAFATARGMRPIVAAEESEHDGELAFTTDAQDQLEA